MKEDVKIDDLKAKAEMHLVCGFGGLFFQVGAPADELAGLDLFDVPLRISVFEGITKFELCGPTVPGDAHPFVW